jgi:hypothetical protein
MCKNVYLFCLLLFIGLSLIACSGDEDKNTAPVAMAKSDLSTIVLGESALISGSTSYDPDSGDVITYRWKLVSLPSESVLPEIISENAYFHFSPDAAGSFQFELMVNDGDLSSTDFVHIQVLENEIPDVITNVDEDYQSFVLGGYIELDASQSIDPEGKELSFKWLVQHVANTANQYHGTNTLFQFEPILLGEHKVTLTVSDGWNNELTEFSFWMVKSSVLLMPSLAAPNSAIAQVEEAFGYNSIDVPQTHDAQHLNIKYDDLVGDYFSFLTHLEFDGDRELPIQDSDRARSEIKTFTGSSEELLCLLGDSMRLNWLFSVDELGVSTSFSHIFQVKGTVAEHPLSSLTLKRTDGISALRLNYGEQDEVLGVLPLDLINNGRWLDITVSLQCAQKGYLRVDIKDHLTREVLLEVEQDNIQMWQESEIFGYGFKFGVYRRIKQNVDDVEFKSGLKAGESEVKLTNLLIEKL